MLNDILCSKITTYIGISICCIFLYSTIMSSYNTKKELINQKIQNDVLRETININLRVLEMHEENDAIQNKILDTQIEYTETLEDIVENLEYKLLEFENMYRESFVEQQKFRGV